MIVSSKVFFLFSLTTMSGLVHAEKAITIAHRGAPGYVPEHTIASAVMAYEMGADFIEPDVVLTKDNVPIVMHDIYLDATTNVKKMYSKRARKDGRFYAVDFTLAEVKTLRANERIDIKSNQPVFSTRFPKGAGHFVVPTLTELIEVLHGLNKTRRRNVGLYPEIKKAEWHASEGKDAVKVVYEALLASVIDWNSTPIYVQSFEPSTLKRLRQEFKSKLPQIQLLPEKGKDARNWNNGKERENRLREIASYADGIGPDLKLVFDSKGMSKGLTKIAHKFGLKVHPYTFRKEKLQKGQSTQAALRMIFAEEGVDGIFSDYPDLVSNYLKGLPQS